MSNSNKFKKFIWGVIFVFAAIACIVATVYIILNFVPSNNSKQYITTAATSEAETEPFDTHNINWKKFEDNTDIYAWIYIPHTKVDYPVAQSGKGRDDFFYLSHNAEGEYEFAGTIYSEKENSKDFSDPVTILYGHNMLNGTMFAGLHKFEKKTFFDDNKYIYIYTPDRKLTYEIYAAYQYDDKHILNSFDFSDDKVLLKYFKSTLNPKSEISNTRPVDLDVNSKTITLSTCTNGSADTRYLVTGVLIKDEHK